MSTPPITLCRLIKPQKANIAIFMPTTARVYTEKRDMSYMENTAQSKTTERIKGRITPLFFWINSVISPHCANYQREQS